MRTNIVSTGISSDLQTDLQPEGTIVVSSAGNIIENVETNGFWNVLPSANLVMELKDNMLLRFAAYSAIARPDPSASSAALNFDDEADLANIAAIVSAEGNPNIKPLEAINFDVSWEYYVTDTTAFTAAVYHKILQTGFETDI